MYTYYQNQRKKHVKQEFDPTFHFVRSFELNIVKKSVTKMSTAFYLDYKCEPYIQSCEIIYRFSNAVEPPNTTFFSNLENLHYWIASLLFLHKLEYFAYIQFLRVLCPGTLSRGFVLLNYLYLLTISAQCQPQQWIFKHCVLTQSGLTQCVH